MRFLSVFVVFFNNAAIMWQDLLDCDLLIVGGDVNSRTKELIDYIPEIDGNLIPKRNNPDKTKNAHGDCFLTFLKENCKQSGRNYK